MSVQSDRVKKWRKNTKQRIIDSMGGKCCCCSYSNCTNALALHHLDPSQKEIGLAAIRASPKSWIKIIEELKKCVLVCHNCHSEIHAGLKIVPENAPKFNENYSEYKLEKTELTDNCPICSELKPIHNKYCSLKCSSKSKFKINWNEIDLTSELKIKSIVTLAKELGCSDAAIHKRLKKLNIARC